MSAYEITDPAAVDEAPPPLAQAQARAVRARFLRRRAARRRSPGIAAAEEARAELVLLREENARLKAAPHQPPSFDRVVGQARALLAAVGDGADAADEASELLVEMVVLRESLLAVCEELERSLAGVRAKLDRIGAETRPGAGDDPAG